MYKSIFIAVIIFVVAGCGHSTDNKFFLPGASVRDHRLIDEDPEVTPFHVYEMYTKIDVDAIMSYYKTIASSEIEFDVDPDYTHGSFDINGFNYQIDIFPSDKTSYMHNVTILYYPDGSL